MSEIDRTGNLSQQRGSLNFVLIVLPATLLGLFSAALFFGFLGDQSTEIAKLIYAIEGDCGQRGQRAFSILFGTGSSSELGGLCATYASKVLLYYVLTMAWCFAAFIITGSLTTGLRSLMLRYIACVVVSISVPLLILVKYFTAIGLSAYFGDGFSLSDISSIPVFSIFLVAIVAFIQLLLTGATFAQGRPPYNSATITFLFILSVVIFGLVAWIFTYHPSNLFDEVGSINLAVLYILLAYASLAGLVHFGRITGHPIVSYVFIYLLLVNLVGVNSALDPANSIVDPQPAQSALSGEDQFFEWLRQRGDRDRFSGKKYPVFIVAAAGGGMYAAMRTAYFLDRIQRSCPAFLHHTFAISSVSGGAIGSLAFVADQHAKGLPNLEAECRIDSILENQPATDQTNNSLTKTTLGRFFVRDVVSAIVGGGLYSGMLQRAIPLPIEGLNRATVFRKALSENWRKALPQSVRSTRRAGPCTAESLLSGCRIDQAWTPDGNFPFMVFNTTWVDVGVPVVLSNLDRTFYPKQLSASAISGNVPVSLLDAASLSARFPIALPAGTLRDIGYTGPMRLVDGGYIDNSGLRTAKAIKDEIVTMLAKRNNDSSAQGGRPDDLPNAEVHIIYLGENYGGILDILNYYGEIEYERDPSDQSRYLPVPGSMDLGSRWGLGLRGAELSAHTKALFRARDQRSLETIRLINTREKKLVRLEWQPTPLTKPDTFCSEIPLAWYFAPCTHLALKRKLSDGLFESTGPLTYLQNVMRPGG